MKKLKAREYRAKRNCKQQPKIKYQPIAKEVSITGSFLCKSKGGTKWQKMRNRY